ncbi:zinc finger BED domain-containing protein 4-like [Ornithodoros turicata]|uniref:zinc finger BED domain-containing protein 4-like n=1 Tax=Ornithodoros turicata TaxID=34597 RepID=UPI003139EBB9
MDDPESDAGDADNVRIASGRSGIWRYYSFSVPNVATQHRRIAQRNIATLPESAATRLPLDKKREPALNAKVAEMIAKDIQPYSFVEEPGFVALIKEAVPNYVMPARTTFSRQVIPRLYHDMRRQVELELSKAFESGTPAAAFRCDMWTSHANDSYISLTCHLMTVDYELRRYTLATRHMTKSHTALNLSSMLQELCSEWHIPSSVTAFIVTDNGRNMRAAVMQLPWKERACFAHTLQLAINDALPQVPGLTELCKKARAIVGHYKHSPAQKRLDDLLLNMNKPTLKVLQDVQTRWNSQFVMFSRLLQLREAVSVELATSNSSIDCFTSTEWRLVSDIVDVLQPFYDATVEVSADRYPTLSILTPIVFVLMECVSQLQHESTLAKCVFKCMRARFVGYELVEVANMTMFLDPRFRCTLYSSDSQMQLWLADQVMKELQPFQEEFSPQKDASSSTAPTSSLSLWNAFERLMESSDQGQAMSLPEREVGDYTKGALLKRSEDPCRWWQTVGRFKYPMLARAALKYLAIPATSVPSERVFSNAG